MPAMLAWVDEVQPTVVQHGDWENPDERVEFHDQDLTPLMVERLNLLAGEQFDTGTCEGSGFDGQGCGQSVGYVLIEPEDNGLGGGTAWRWTTAVEISPDETQPHVAIVVCEECTPVNAYPLPKER